ncbi:Holliday junction branch migration protein RuvA [Vulgatibacter incomptus]|uniref:Holliday junction branch migration complex subunit RuvA n=1 Tax=Vulgatibacter incomptus TaxID=1391653 RepID=A0A0K1PCX3_9BACT|nr:Holliday junction branch migration protein RuvA [Vulgatibacter incomptus]AKU91352.1 Holliday junction DNA helicase RuvA [Vulgatibacter incomptus]
MIAQLKGTVDRKAIGGMILDVGGVGYLVTCSETTLARLPTGAQVTMRIHTAVREDAIELFGFSSELEEALFRELIRVQGVGPRAAMNLLSGGEPEEIAAAIVGGDLARLKKLPGVGKKTAERLVLDLRERLASFVPASTPRAAPAVNVVAPKDELFRALEALGFKPAEADRLAAEARGRAAADASLEDLVREALRAR